MQQSKEEMLHCLDPLRAGWLKVNVDAATFQNNGRIYRDELHYQGSVWANGTGKVSPVIGSVPSKGSGSIEPERSPLMGHGSKHGRWIKFIIETD